MEDKVDFIGYDLEEKKDVKTKEDCCNVCARKEGCTFFSYKQHQEKCWLKTSDAGRKANDEAVSGSVDCCKGNN